MTWNPLQILLTLVGGLVLAAIIGWVKKSRVTVLVPRLFSHSVLTAKGQLAEISVFNRGLRTEESIEISLSPNLDYEIVGSNSPNIELRGKSIMISRIGAGDDATVILLVEGGVFSKADIINCLSKETKGVVVSSLENVPLTGQQRIGSIAALLIFCLIGGGFNLAIDHYFSGEKTSASVVPGRSEPLDATDDGWSIPEIYRTRKSPLYAAVTSRRVTVAIGTPARKGDLLSIPLTLRNSSDLVVEATFSLNSEATGSKIPIYKLREHGILVTPSGEATRTIAVVVPEKGTKQSEKNVYIDVFLQEHGGDSIRLTRVFEAK